MSRLALARLAHTWRRWMPVVLGLAVAIAIPVVVSAVGSATAVSALRRQLADLPPGERSVTVSYNGILDRAELARLDGMVRTAVPRIAAPTIRRQMLFRQIAEGGGAGAGSFVLAGADDLSGGVRVLSGRLPAACTPTRCEVAVLAGAPAPPSALGLVVVGRVERRDPLLLSGTFDPGPGVPVLIGDGVERVAALSSLSSFGRSTGLVSSLDAERVRRIGLDAWVREGAAVAEDLWRDGEGLVVTAPVEVVREQDRRARLSTQRFGLLGSSMAVLLLATAVVGGASVRHDHVAFIAALRLRGAGNRQVMRLSAVEVSSVTIAGGLLGVAIGAAGVVVIGVRTGLPAGPTLAEALRSATPLGLGLLVVGGVLIWLTLRGRPMWSAVGGTALATAAGAALLAVRGGVGTSDGGDPLLTLLPALVLASAALGAGGAWPAFARLGTRLLPRRALAARLGVGAVAGRPLRPAATAALLTAAVAAATFAASYRATLEAGAADQAAYAVPLDARLVVGRAGQRPQDAVGPAVLREVTGGRPGAVVPVVRAAASVRLDAEQGAPVQLIGLSPQALTRIARWSAVTGAPPGGVSGPQELVTRLGVPGVPAGTLLPVGRALRIPTDVPLEIAATAHLRSPDGRERAVPLAVEGSGGSVGLSARLPDLRDASGAMTRLALVAISLRQPADSATVRQHNLGEGGRDRAAPTGAFTLGLPEVDGTPVAGAWTRWATGAGQSGQVVTTGSSGGSLAVAYRLVNSVVVLDGRAGAPGGPGRPLPVIADAATAATARDGRITLTLDAVPLPAQVVGVLDRFPTTAGRFVVADGDALAAVIDARTPGAGQAAEVWLDLPVRSAGPGWQEGQAARVALAGAPFDRVEVRLRTAEESQARSDPVARAASGLLAGTALAVLVIAALALVLLVVGERREDAARSFAWEADGVTPRQLRATLWWRAAAVAALAVPLGIAVGIGLSGATARLVAVTAVAGSPQPPLTAATGVGWAVGLLLAGSAGALSVAGVIAGSMMREHFPTRVWGRR